MKIYAELHGDMQKYRIKSRCDNILDCMTSMSNLAKAIPQRKTISSQVMTANMAKSLAGIQHAFASVNASKLVGGEPSPCYGVIRSMHRVNSGELS